MTDRDKRALKALGVFALFFAFLGFMVFGGDDDSAERQTEPSVAQTETVDAVAAQDALDALIEISKHAGLITSYEFSDVAVVVYVTDVWYGLDVSAKKSLLTQIGLLKEQATGYHQFEVRHSKSNEKVGEVTAFSGSVEIYK